MIGRDGEIARSARPLLWAVCLWASLLMVAVAAGGRLDACWKGWRFAFGAAAFWGLAGLMLRYVVGQPFRWSRIPILAAAFSFLITVVGWGNYWATLQLYPEYRVPIERTAYFLAVCTVASLVGTACVLHMLRESESESRPQLVWEWPKLRLFTYVLTAIAAVGTALALQRIAYIPVLQSGRLAEKGQFSVIGGVWFRLSMLGVVAVLLAGVQMCARRATLALWITGALSLIMVSVYGPRFFVALPVAVILLLWDRVRAPISLKVAVVALAVGMPILVLIGFRRLGQSSATLLDPLQLVLYGSFGEFRDLGWALEHYASGDRLLHGGTLGSLVVPLLPAVVWRVVGIDKQAVYDQSSANILAEQMGQDTGQRIGAYGEFFMNFGWAGAIVGAVFYGALLGYVDQLFRQTDARSVRAIALALAAVTLIFAQVGQLNMFTSTLTGFGYPIAVVALFSSRRALGG